MNERWVTFCANKNEYFSQFLYLLSMWEGRKPRLLTTDWEQVNINKTLPMNVFLQTCSQLRLEGDHVDQLTLSSSSRQPSQIKSNQLSRIWTLQMSRGTALHLYPGEREGPELVITMMESISVTGPRTARMVTMRTRGSARLPGGRQWRRPPAS